jgi:O-antigen ligase
MYILLILIAAYTTSILNPTAVLLSTAIITGITLIIRELTSSHQTYGNQPKLDSLILPPLFLITSSLLTPANTPSVLIIDSLWFLLAFKLTSCPFQKDHLRTLFPILLTLLSFAQAQPFPAACITLTRFIHLYCTLGVISFYRAQHVVPYALATIAIGSFALTPTYKGDIATIATFSIAFLPSFPAAFTPFLLPSCILTLFLNQSAMGRVSAALLLPFTLIHCINRKTKRFNPLFWGLSLLASITALYHYPAILSLLGKNTTITGRQSIWRTALDWTIENPILGNGYHFWHEIGANTNGNEVLFRALHGHNILFHHLPCYGIPATIILLVTCIFLVLRTAIQPIQKTILLLSLFLPGFTEPLAIDRPILWFWFLGVLSLPQVHPSQHLTAHHA